MRIIYTEIRLVDLLCTQKQHTQLFFWFSSLQSAQTHMNNLYVDYIAELAIEISFRFISFILSMGFTTRGTTDSSCFVF